MISYAHTRGSPEAILIYPEPLNRPFDETIRGIRVRSLTFSLNGDLEQAGQSYPFSSDMTLPSPVLAMAHHRAGRANDAAAALEEAAATLDSWLDVMAQGSVESMPVPWVDFVEHLLLYREATKLITGASPEEDPRLAMLEERAHSAIEAQ
jgi:hypothetical protein